MSAEFVDERWYCLRCPVHPLAEGFATAWDCKQHVEREHDIAKNELTKGDDYAEGWQARRLYVERVVQADAPTKRMSAFFADKKYTVEDFLIDCGVPVADEDD